MPCAMLHTCSCFWSAAAVERRSYSLTICRVEYADSIAQDDLPHRNLGVSDPAHGGTTARPLAMLQCRDVHTATRQSPPSPIAVRETAKLVSHQRMPTRFLGIVISS